MKDKKTSYDESSNLWVLSRNTKNLKDVDPKMLKQNRPHFFVEKPAMHSKVDDLSGKKVLCLGCGSGEEVELLRENGAVEIVGIDISEELIKHAKENHPDCEFHVMDAEDMTFENETFDYVFSSLVMHYFEKWEKVVSEIYRVMKNNSIFLFSTVHPVKWSAQKLNDEDGKAYATLMGFQNNSETGELEILGDYQNTVKLTETWMKSLTVTFYPRSISSMFRSLSKGGFEIIDIFEPKCIVETKEYDMDYYLINQKIPNFIIFELRK